MPKQKKDETIEQWISRILQPLEEEIQKTKRISKDLMDWYTKLNFVEGLRSSKGEGNDVKIT